MTKPKSSENFSAKLYATRVKRLSQKSLDLANKLAVGKKIDEKRENLKASNRSDYELTEADRKKVTVCDGFNDTKGRYWVDPASVPVFRYGGQA